MARAIWTGVLSFGLVSVPVGLFSATEDHEVGFHQYEEGTEDRIRYKRVNERTDDEVEYADIVKGADVGSKHPVMVEQSELDAVAPGQSKSLEIDVFVDLDEIDPLHFDKSYYLGPRDKDTSKAYALLRDAMAAANKAAIAKFVMRGKEYLAAIRADEKVMVLETLYFADEIRDPRKQIDDLPAKTKASGNEWKMATQLIDTMSGEWQPGSYQDDYTERVKALVDAKKEGVDIDVAEEAPDATNVVDLVAALRASVEAAKKRSAGTKKKATTKPAAKKSATKKATSNKTSTTKATTKKATTRKATAKKAS